MRVGIIFDFFIVESLVFRIWYRVGSWYIKRRLWVLMIGKGFFKDVGFILFGFEGLEGLVLVFWVEEIVWVKMRRWEV